MDDKKLQEYRNFFWSFDKDQDGRLSRDEFLLMIKKMGIKLNAEEERKIFKNTDKDKTGLITFNEFLDAFIYKKSEKSPNTGAVEEAFVMEDLDRDGYLNREECFRAMKHLGYNLDHSVTGRLVELMDKNHDGRVSFQEFCYFVQL